MLTEPFHFWIGLKNEYYTLKLLSLTVIKGILMGLMITLIVFCSLNGLNIQSTGFNGSFWLSSAVLYGIVVVDANIFILQQSSTHTWPSLVLIFASILSYYLLFWLENLFPWSGPMYSIFDHTMNYGRIYMVMVINTLLLVAIEMIWCRW